MFTTTQFHGAECSAGKVIAMGTEITICSLEREMAFTRAFAAHEEGHPYTREIACLRAQYPARLGAIIPGDWFAGRHDPMLVGYAPEHNENTQVAYHCCFDALRALCDAPETPDATRADAAYLLEFWQSRQYYLDCRAAFPPAAQHGLPSDDFYDVRQVAHPFYAICGLVSDYGMLVRLGIAGLRDRVDRAVAGARDEEARQVYQGMQAALSIFTDCAYWYAAQAQALAMEATDAGVRDRLLWMAGNLAHIAEEEPRHYGEAIQLLWLYSIIAVPRGNYGRLDVILGDFLAHDLDADILSYDDARAMTIGLWDLILARSDVFNNRIVIGGMGRPNPANADRFAMLALEVQGITGYHIPQLSLRWHAGMPEAIWERALEVIAGGSTHPMLFNDDVNVTGVETAFAVSRAEAEQYFMYGCGEYILDHRGVNSPQGALNVALALEATLHDGRSLLTGDACGLALGALTAYPTFADLQQAFTQQVAVHLAHLADAAAAIYRVTGEVVAFPFISLLYDDCLARGKALLDGGARYLGAVVETFGNISAADSLLAIKRTVYDERTLDPATLLTALAADFAGYADVQARLQRVAKYGNDDADADAMALWVNTVLCEQAMQQARRVGLDSFLVVLVNNGEHVTTGRGVGAGADGRHAGMPLSNGNQPTAGNDRRGVTALLTSMTTLPPSLHAGATHNLKLSRQTVTNQRQEMSALLRGFFARGGTQIMISITDRGELEDALYHPERHQNLIIRVGGYSAHFITLDKDLQLDVLARTLY